MASEKRDPRTLSVDPGDHEKRLSNPAARVRSANLLRTRLAATVDSPTRWVMESLVGVANHPSGPSTANTPLASSAPSLSELTFSPAHQTSEADLARAAALERNRIALYLHDQIGQILAGASILTASLEQRLRGDARPEADALAMVVEQLGHAYRQVRDLAKALGPITAQSSKLVQFLSKLAKHTRLIYGIAADYVGPEDVHVDSADVAEHLYRIAQEAVTNSVRHAQPRRVVVSLRDDSDGLHLEIRDDGVGISQSRSTSGFGLRGMRYRARLIGARLVIEPGRDSGTVVRCMLPNRSVF